MLRTSGSLWQARGTKKLSKNTRVSTLGAKWPNLQQNTHTHTPGENTSPCWEHGRLSFYKNIALVGVGFQSRLFIDLLVAQGTLQT